MYYFFTQDLDVEGVAEISGHTEVSGQYLWTLGKPFEKSMPLQILELDTCDGDSMPDFFDSSIPVISNKFLDALNEIGIDNFETYPVILKDTSSDKEFLDYLAINFIGCFDAVAQDKSEFELDSFGDAEYSSIVIDPSKICDNKIFRLVNGPDLLVVHQDIVEKLKEYDLKSLSFQETTDFDEF